MYAKTLSSRLQSYVGVDTRSHWGPKAAELGIDALSGSSPVASTHQDFSTFAVPSATALAASPLNYTVTPIDIGISGNSTVANSSNGYLLITPGTVAASGYNIQGVKSNVVFQDSMQFITANSGLASGRDIYFGIRAAISCNTTWDGAVFFGLAASDTGLMTPATGALDSIANCMGVHIGLTGAINLTKLVSSAAQVSSTFTATANTLKHTSSSFRAQDFHDYFIWIHYSTASGASSGTHWMECYLDGKLAASVGPTTSLTLPNLTTSQYPTIEVLNGTAGLVTMAIAEIVTGVVRYVAP